MLTKRVKEPYFGFLTRPVNGAPLKTKEGRVRDGDWTEKILNKVVAITNDAETALVTFTAVRWYDRGDLAASVREMLEKEGIGSLLPDLGPVLSPLSEQERLEKGVALYLGLNRDKGPDKTKIGAFDVALL